MTHQLKNGFTATRTAAGTFDVYRNGVFLFNTARLKFAKSHAAAAA